MWISGTLCGRALFTDDSPERITPVPLPTCARMLCPGSGLNTNSCVIVLTRQLAQRICSAVSTPLRKLVLAGMLVRYSGAHPPSHLAPDVGISPSGRLYTSHFYANMKTVNSVRLWHCFSALFRPLFSTGNCMKRKTENLNLMQFRLCSKSCYMFAYRTLVLSRSPLK